jgi:uncharacterized protein (TIGR03437 family)
VRDVAEASVDQEYVSVRVPFNASEGVCDIVVRSGAFEDAVSVKVTLFKPRFASGIIHEQFRGLVTVDDPAIPNEVVSAYIGGLGPPRENGQPQTPGFRCRINSTDAEVAYIGYQEQYPGLYQVNVRIPANVPVSRHGYTLWCGFNEVFAASVSISIRP